MNQLLYVYSLPSSFGSGLIFTYFFSSSSVRYSFFWMCLGTIRLGISLGMHSFETVFIRLNATAVSNSISVILAAR